MSESAFLNLVRGNRLSMYMGLQMDPDTSYRHSKDYTYIEVPLGSMYNPAQEQTVDSATRNQHLRIIPACKLNVKGPYRVLVKTNPKLQEVSNCPAMFVIDPDDGEQPSFYATFVRGLDAKDLDWCVRLYMFS